MVARRHAAEPEHPNQSVNQINQTKAGAHSRAVRLPRRYQTANSKREFIAAMPCRAMLHLHARGNNEKAGCWAPGLARSQWWRSPRGGARRREDGTHDTGGLVEKNLGSAEGLGVGLVRWHMGGWAGR